jgi:type I protein arginine methyltransferase
MTYSLRAYGEMIGDPVRASAFAGALGRVVRPGDAVLELGAGTGILSLLACRFGARHVYACDPNPAIHLARELARDNGFGDRVTCYQTGSEQLHLPEQVDVIVEDLRGVLPLFGRHLPVLIDARARHLKPDGRLVLSRDRLLLALVEAPEEHDRFLRPWGKNDFGFRLERWSSLLANAWKHCRLDPSQLLTPATVWGELDYRRISSPNLRGTASCGVARAGVAHGFLVWFETTMADGSTFSTGPGATETIYRSVFFPFPQALGLEEGDEVDVTLDASLIGDQYNWSWRTRARSRAREEIRFEQSSFFGSILAAESLRRRAADHVPELDDEGRLVLRVLEQLAQHTQLGQIAGQLLDEFPGRFAGHAESLGFVGEMSTKYGA